MICNVSLNWSVFGFDPNQKTPDLMRLAGADLLLEHGINPLSCPHVFSFILGADCVLNNLRGLEPDGEDLDTDDYLEALQAAEHYHAFIRAMTFPFVPKRGLKEGVTHHQIHVPEYDGEDWSHLLPPITDSLREQRDEDEIPMLLVHDEQRRAEYQRLIGPPTIDLYDRLFCQFQGGLSLTKVIVCTAELSVDADAIVEYCFRRMIRDYLDYIPHPVMTAAKELL